MQLYETLSLISEPKNIINFKVLHCHRIFYPDPLVDTIDIKIEEKKRSFNIQFKTQRYATLTILYNRIFQFSPKNKW